MGLCVLIAIFNIHLFYQIMQSISTTKISFKSYITPVSEKEFQNVASTIPNSQSTVQQWSTDDIIIAEKAKTKNIKDCTAGGITDGKKVLLFHLAPSEENFIEFKKFINNIKSKIPTNKDELQGFIIGSARNNRRSRKMFEMIEGLFKDLGINYTKLKGQSHTNDTDILYDTTKDSWLISNKEISQYINEKKSPKEIFAKVFETVKIAEFDEIV